MSDDNSSRSGKGMGIVAATSIGIGGMIGAGIFSLLGIAATMSGDYTYLAFLISGIVALFCAYSFGKLGARFPSAGGPVEYLVRGIENRVLTGGLNLLLWFGYIIVNALYARTFAEYAVALLGLDGASHLPVAILATGVVLAFVAVNRLGGGSVGRMETLLVVAKLIILLGFAGAAGYTVADFDAVPSAGNLAAVAFTAGLVFMAYEGFGLVTNAADDMRDVERTLPRALILSVVIVAAVYMLISVVVTGSMQPESIAEAKEYALAEAARPVFGSIGFDVMAIAALLSTASAINATLYGGANVSYIMAEKGQLPGNFRRRLWQVARGGLMITATLIVITAVALPVERIAMAGSLAFLTIYAAVNAAHYRLTDETGGRPAWIGVGLAGCVSGALALGWHVYRTAPEILAVFVAMTIASFGIEYLMIRRHPHRASIKSCS